MLNPAHILEVAFLLLGAFLLGATIGALARLLAVRVGGAGVAAPVATTPAPDAVAEAKPPLVAAPTIDPVAKPATPVAPADVPAPDFAETVQAIASPKVEALASMAEIRMPSVAPLPALEAKRPTAEMAPARIPGQATSGRLVASPIVKEEGAQRAAADSGVSAEVIPFPIERASGAAEEHSTQGADDTISTSVDVEPSVDASEDNSGSPMGAVEAESKEVEPSPAVGTPTKAKEEPVSTAVAERVTAEAAPAAEPVPLEVPSSGASSDDDEAAAMRAIEGNWSPRRGATGHSRKAAIPEGLEADSAVAAAGAAGKAATDAAAAVVADPPVELPGKPAGMAAARHGAKDNLTNVIGILPIIETALNSIGVYHFDQIADFTDENVAWLEGHLGIAGRIGREHWREQARELAVVSERARKVAGQQ